MSTDLPQNGLLIPKNQDKLDELEDDSTGVFKLNIIERYCNRPTLIASVDKICLAEFSCHFYRDYTNRDEHFRTASALKFLFPAVNHLK